ncbi:MAG: hypothetical protein WCC53_02235, partial [Thermoanaerobaculia bacterium]
DSWFVTVRDLEKRPSTEFRYDAVPGTTRVLKDYVYLGNQLVGASRCLRFVEEHGWMKGTQSEKLIREHILPSMPGFQAKGKLLFASPVTYVLRGYCFEDSGFDPSAFTVSVFVQPLYVPFPALVLSLGDRLGHIAGGPDKWWYFMEGNESVVMAEVRARILDEGEKHFRVADDPGALIWWLKARKNEETHYSLKALAYSYILIGRADEGLRVMDKVEKILAADGRDWCLKEIALLNEVRAALRSGLQAARQLLDRWADQTARAIHISRSAAPQAPIDHLTDS